MLIDGLKYKTATGLEVDKQQITFAAYPTKGSTARRSCRRSPAARSTARMFSAGASFSTGRCRTAADGVLVFQGRVSTVDSVGRTQAKITVASDLGGVGIRHAAQPVRPDVQSRPLRPGLRRQRAPHSRSRARSAPARPRRTINWAGAQVGHGCKARSPCERLERRNSDHHQSHQPRRRARPALSAALSGRRWRHFHRLLRLRPYDRDLQGEVQQRPFTSAASRSCRRSS